MRRGTHRLLGRMRARIAGIAGFLWAAPCSLVGLAAALPVLCAGGTARRIGHTLEVALGHSQREVPTAVARVPFLAITLGHVIVGQSHEALGRMRTHERVHVRQYERLGPLFFVAYAGSSLIAWCRGGSLYRDNYFERQAFASTRADTASSQRTTT